MIQKNISLLNYNTMRIDVKAKKLFVLENTNELNEYFVEDSKEPLLIIGGGSNVLFTKDFDGIIIKNEIIGLEILEETMEKVKVKVGGGENWNNFVESTIANGWSGIENLVLIPGTVGASPVQNIGAYGQEVSDCLVEVEAFDFATSKFLSFNKQACNFSYRNSIFKSELKNKVIITSVIFELNKIFKPNLSFPSLINSLEEKKIMNPTIREIADTIIEIRNSKLPDINKLGNCGSFFTNPFLNKSEFEEFNLKNPEAPYYKYGNGYKLSAGWLIEKCGWKGKIIGKVGTYKDHSLVIVNYGEATGKEVIDFANMIRNSVYEKFNILLDTEVNIIN
jgi:UDP-N-acetylmuramate dehydrogenase